ncbi:hypothetical protein L1987_32356 [Smallanthus sonchifolius]|uniref:Uncharacterized protein n=1 Tax=Smallanthus sonchifolius TaxID=185202 RepID=A0ACB9I8Q8_9ASTR|nr:hypothetical protein L1987_32356 [Smallanthus sonchifolius]
MEKRLPLLPSLLFSFFILASSQESTKPGCPSKCGNLSVPYPFGIGSMSGCSIGPWYDIICEPPKAFLSSPVFSYSGSFDGTNDNASLVEVVDISSNHVRIKNTISTKCFNTLGESTHFNTAGLVVATCFTLSELNKVFVIGCDDFSITSPVSGIDQKNFSSGCVSMCSKAQDIIAGSCTGIGCCETSLPKGLTTYVTVINSFNNHTNISSFSKCGYSFLGEQNTFKFRGASDLSEPGFLERTSGNGGYRCSCNNGYQGNPYLSPGCQDIDECADPNNNPCDGICSNFRGHFNCSCPHGYVGDGRKDGSGCTIRNSKSPALKISLGMGFGFLFILAGITWLYLSHKRRKVMKLKAKPKMMEVAIELDGLKDLTQHPWANQSANEDGMSLMDKSKQPDDLYDVSAVGSSKSSFNIFGQYSSDQILSLMNLEN